MVKPELMCNMHLLGEHVELHMFVGTMKLGRSLTGYVRNNLVEPRSIVRRHQELAFEMIRRGMKHNSDLIFDSCLLDQYPYFVSDAMVDVQKTKAILLSRCTSCMGSVAERLMVPDLKSGVSIRAHVGSNPTASAKE